MSSIQYCRQNWTGNLATDRQVAGEAMANALRKVGLVSNPLGSSTNVGVVCGWDSYEIPIPDASVEEMVAALRTNPRVTRIRVAGVERTEKTVEDVEKELEAFKAKVVEIAMKKAKEHDWCDVVKAALTEMGLEIPKEKARVVLEIDLSDTGVDGDDLDAIREHVRWSMSKPDLQDAVVSTELVKG